MLRIENSINMPKSKKATTSNETKTDYTNSVMTEAKSKTKPYDGIITGTTNSDRIEIFGITHYRYQDCNPEDLVTVNGMKVRKDCAEAFKRMQAAARKDGAHISVVSGYRSSTYQIRVFKKKFKDVNGNPTYPTDAQMKSRLKYSAPSGFSEHHTGLAVDINETETRFKNTKEYKWLMEHAGEYGFEISFPQDNAQGLGFEPWHWRYVGENGENKPIFSQARKNDPRFAEEYNK